MTIRVALHHKTHYTFDRPVSLSPHEVRLRPAAHARTPIESYSLKVRPEKHFLNWQQDPYGNWLARLVFPEKATELCIEVDLVADMTVINPFDFFLEAYAEAYPFQYTKDNQRELTAYLEVDPAGPLLTEWMADARRELLAKPINTIDFLVALNARLQRDISYLIRMEPGVQTPEETLQRAQGSCRDTGWLLVQICRHFGIASRFASGYLIQLVADQKALDGPSGTERDFTDLHAWCEAYLPGAGWIGLDPTSGLLAGEGHIPLACTAIPSSAAPVSGFTDICESSLDFQMTVTRIHEDPRVTKPFVDSEWQHVLALGDQVDRELVDDDVRLTMGGEPTFVSVDDMEGAEWNFTAHSPKKLALATTLFMRTQEKFAPGGLLHFGQGKWYPGEPLPRWALSCYWRPDGVALWNDRALIATETTTHAKDISATFARALASELGLHTDYAMPAYESIWRTIRDESQLPINLDPTSPDLKDAKARRAIAEKLLQQLEGAIGEPVGYVLPLKALERKKPADDTQWASSLWPLPTKHLYLVEGDSPVGFRLPLNSLPWVAPDDVEIVIPSDPFETKVPLVAKKSTSAAVKTSKSSKPTKTEIKAGESAKQVVRTALCVEVRNGILHVFMPPLALLEDYLALVTAIETVAASLKTPVRLEGYTPPSDDRLKKFAVTPDPGVIEFNIHPTTSWRELVANTKTLYEEARLSRLGTEKFMLDGKHSGTGGGNHVTVGGVTPADSPLLRRPDLLRSLITYWPALSYLFSGTFIGPTSQSPRVDEARSDTLYELEIAFEQMEEKLSSEKESEYPWLADRILRNFLVDLTGNTHRAEFSIDKLYSPDGPTGRLGLLEFRAFEMPPHAEMSLTQTLLLRALIARFWKIPYKAKLVRWGTELHDRFMLPYFVAQDMRAVIDDLNAAGYAFKLDWFAPFLEFRFPRFGTVAYQGVQMELRQAIEPWHVLGEEMAGSGTSRYVDSSVERMQVKVSGMMLQRHVVTCNGRVVPLTPTGTPGEFVAGVRYRAWAPPSALHPTIGVHSPLVFDLVDTWSGRSVGGCTYHVSHPGGRNYATFPINANEAEARRVARFQSIGHTPGPISVRNEGRNPAFPFTLDLRRAPDDDAQLMPLRGASGMGGAVGDKQEQ
jgi:uncharacterized protein (DUF2126 family)/transglutaminase-like putative cysteine protease